MRTFEDNPAVREMTPLWVGIAGPSGCGKTYSALRLARGIQRVTGGEIFGIDTEGRRMLHYAEDFTFRHVPFGPPFRSLDYLEAVRHCARNKAAVIVIDSVSHEHEGSGGYLEFHAEEENRMRNNPAANFAAWQAPSKQRNELIQGLLQLPISFVFCFRGKEKLKPGKEKADDGKGKSVMRELGWMPIGGQAFIYEMTVCCLLTPGSCGVPSWNAAEFSAEQKLWIKRPKQFAKLLAAGVQLSEEVGEGLARWSTGGKALPEGWSAQQAQSAAAASVASGAKPQIPTGPDHSTPCPLCSSNRPRCRADQAEMEFVRAGVARGNGELYDAYWRCPNKCRDPKDKRSNTSVRAETWHRQLEQAAGAGNDDPERQAIQAAG